ncbi:MAG TPA: hypothetical protein PK079_18240 [Leptospiraceae bacterium]|nr:hypothetical protein [Leptospiraceae bacterium]HMX34698.1 hypothetical protein [Leptospiraceae bacterium]HMY33765.1 hypothetical protein [Leptospiraceae bacterium]HMZ64863.1 hypothetical protein [Leptospiraceae bacterium]HNA08869.1 hypothetical protein [Leptospiraceae bacterium]
MRFAKLIILVIIFFPVLFSIKAETRVELKAGISLSDFQPEFQKRYYLDDLIAGGSDGLGFGAINRKYSQSYFAALLNPFDFKFFLTKSDYVFLFGAEYLGLNGMTTSRMQSNFNYSPTGFFMGEGSIDSKARNANTRLSAGRKFDSIIISGLIMKRDFQSEYEKIVILYAPGFLGRVNAESNYYTSNLFAGFSVTKLFEKGKITTEVSFRPKNQGGISSAGKIEQLGVIRFPVDIPTGNLSSELLVTNYLYGDKKPNIFGVRILMDYQYPVYENFSISFTIDYDRLYVYYNSYQPPAFFRFANASGISKPEIAYAEILSSYIIYRDPILNEIKSLRLGALVFF